MFYNIDILNIVKTGTGPKPIFIYQEEENGFVSNRLGRWIISLLLYTYRTLYAKNTSAAVSVCKSFIFVFSLIMISYNLAN